jgi:streptogramin lyase
MVGSLRPPTLSLSLLLVLACGGNEGNGDDELGSLDSPSSSGESAAEAEAESMSGSTSDTNPTDTSPTDTGPTDTNPTESDDGIKFDLGVTDMADTGGDPCGGGGDVEFSHIWIANSPYGTVSKIDTQTLTELARYQVRPQGGGQPSRTSVNVRGDMVVGSREGGVTKIWAREDDCVDDNGTPGIQTSSGKNDVLAWNQEECVAWYTDSAFTSLRAVAWTAGDYDVDTCTFSDAKVWVGATSDAVTLTIQRLDGDTGVVEDSIQIPGTQGLMDRSPYGAAVDSEGNAWMVNAYCGGTLIRVDNDDLSYELIAPPPELCPYGIAVDAEGYVWIGGYQTYSGRYDPVTQEWDLVQAQGLGLQEDAEGRIWLGAYGQNGVYAIDGDTLQVLSYTPLPTPAQSKGVAVDFYGYVWIVADGGTTNAAIRLDPDTMQFQSYDGLDSPYSYSDMTGFALKNAGVPVG